MLPYFAVARMLIALLGSVADSAYYGRWCLLAAAGLKVLFSIWSTSVLHSVTYKTLREIRKTLISKLSRQLKDMIVDRVEGLETTLAHMVPEMTENLLIPICLLVYLFVLDWRMALVSLITLPVGMAFVLIMARTYPAKYEGSVQVSRQMMSEVVEYIGGIEVIKAFNQNAKSYQRYTDAVNADAAYFYNWMKICQWPMSAYTAICPATLLTVLPIGFLFYANGSLSTPDFITVIVLSLGIIGPILAVSNYIGSLAILGTVMNDIGSLLDKPELIRPTEKVELKDSTIELRDVTFSYAADGKEILHDIDLTIKPGSVTALVGPSGSGKSTIAKLIAGFWDVNGGSILLGGLPRLYHGSGARLRHRCRRCGRPPFRRRAAAHRHCTCHAQGRAHRHFRRGDRVPRSGERGGRAERHRSARGGQNSDRYRTPPVHCDEFRPDRRGQRRTH